MSQAPALGAVLITRMSMDKQQNSPERQREAFAAYCERYDLRPCGEYADLGVSATKTRLLDRPAILRLLAEAPAAKWSIVWFEEVSRAARKGEEVVDLNNRLLAHNKFLVGPDDDPRREVDAHFRKLLLFIKGWEAEGETIKTKNRVGDTGQYLAGQGRVWGGPLPPGLRWQFANPDKHSAGGEYLLDEATAPLARRVYELYVETGSFNATSRCLHAEGFVGARGGPLRVARVRKLLTCPAYRGGRSYRGVFYPAEIPQVVPPALIARVDELLAQCALRPQRTGGQHNSSAIFAGLLKCPACGAWLVVQPSARRKGGGWYYSYRCNRTYAPPQTCDWRRHVPEVTFEQEVMPALLWQLRHLHLPEPSRQARRHQQQERERKRLQAERQRIIALHVKGRLGEEEADKLLDRVDAQLAKSQDDAPPPLPTITAEEVRQAGKQIEKLWPGLTPQQKRGLLQTVILHITPAEPWADSEVAWRV